MRKNIKALIVPLVLNISPMKIPGMVFLSNARPRRPGIFLSSRDISGKIPKQAGAELGQTQLKLEMDFTLIFF